MRYIGMPMGMWVLFGKSFHDHLVSVNTDGRSLIGYDVFIKRQEDYHDENSERSIGAIRRLSGYASLLR